MPNLLVPCLHQGILLSGIPTMINLYITKPAMAEGRQSCPIGLSAGAAVGNLHLALSLGPLWGYVSTLFIEREPQGTEVKSRRASLPFPKTAQVYLPALTSKANHHELGPCGQAQGHGKERQRCLLHYL